jgi:hypothetical protein
MRYSVIRILKSDLAAVTAAIRQHRPRARFAANVGYNAPHARRVSLLDKVLAETNATDRAKEYEIARNEVRHAIRHYVSESGCTVWAAVRTSGSPANPRVNVQPSRQLLQLLKLRRAPISGRRAPHG